MVEHPLLNANERYVQQPEQLSATLSNKTDQEGFTTDFYIPMRSEHVLKRSRSHSSGGRAMICSSIDRQDANGWHGGTCQTRADLSASTVVGAIIPDFSSLR